MQTLNNEQSTIQNIEQRLACAGSVSLLVEGEREAIELPATVVQILKQVVAHMAQGRKVFIVSASPMVNAQEAASLLNVSKNDLLQLLDEGKIPSTLVRTRPRIMISDIEAYKRQRELERAQTAVADVAEKREEPESGDELNYSLADE